MDLPPAIAEAVAMRELLIAVDAAAMDAWDFDVVGISDERLVAHICRMFMQQGLCQPRVHSPFSSSCFPVLLSPIPDAMQPPTVALTTPNSQPR